MKIRPVGAEMFHAGGRTDRHDEANRRFSQFRERAKKISIMVPECCGANVLLSISRIMRAKLCVSCCKGTSYAEFCRTLLSM